MDDIIWSNTEPLALVVIRSNPDALGYIDTLCYFGSNKSDYVMLVLVCCEFAEKEKA